MTTSPHPNPETSSFPGERILVLIMVALAIASIVCPLTFRLVLASSGLEPFDLWGSGRIRPIPSNALSFVRPGELLTSAGAIAALAAAVLALVLFAAARRWNRKSVARTAICSTIIALAGFFYSLNLGFLLAGI